MYNITISPAVNGWIVNIGCQTFVATDKEKMLSEIGRYIADPQVVEKEYAEKAVNKQCCGQADLDMPATPGNLHHH